MSKSITRHTVFGNPIQKNTNCPVCQKVHRSAGDSIPCFKRYLWGRIKEQFWARQLARKARIAVETKRTFTQQLMDLSGEKLIPVTAAHSEVLQAAVQWLEPRM